MAAPVCSKPAVEEVTDSSLSAMSSKAARDEPFCKGDPPLFFGDTVSRTSAGEAVVSELPAGGDSGLGLALVEGGVSSWPAFPPSIAAKQSMSAEGLCSLLDSRLVMRSATLDPNLASPPRGTPSSLSAVALHPSATLHMQLHVTHPLYNHQVQLHTTHPSYNMWPCVQEIHPYTSTFCQLQQIRIFSQTHLFTACMPAHTLFADFTGRSALDCQLQHDCLCGVNAKHMRNTILA